MYQNKQFIRIEKKLDYIIGLLEAQKVEPPPAEPAAPPAPEPFDGYGRLNVAETLEALSEFKEDKAFIARALEYERAHANRVGVINPLVNWNG